MDQPPEQARSLARPQIQRYRLLVAGLGEPGECRIRALGRGAKATERISSRRPLDFDDLRAEFRENGRTVRGGDERRDVQYAHA